MVLVLSVIVMSLRISDLLENQVVMLAACWRCSPKLLQRVNISEVLPPCYIICIQLLFYSIPKP